jgi:hypothetical protein
LTIFQSFKISVSATNSMLCLSRFAVARTAAVVRRLVSSASTKSTMYLHVGPSGDCWTGASLYAAKHLQPDYVKSIPLPPTGVCLDSLLERLEEDLTFTQQIYDAAMLPEWFLEEFMESTDVVDEEKSEK